MTHPREAPDESSFEDFLWEVDVTRRRPAAEHPTPPAPTPERATASVPTPAPAPTPARPAYRSTQPQPGAFRTRSRISRRRLAQLAAGILLVGGTACLVTLALMR